MKFNALQVNHIRKSTEDSIEIGFDIPENLQENYQFQSGQFVVLKLNIDGEEYRREYSIYSAPHENQLRVCTKAIDGGKVSQYLVNNLKVGDEVKVAHPMGKFGIPIKPNEKRTIVLFAAGSGITPIYSILKNILHHEKDTHVYLFYTNKTENSIIFKEDLEELAEKSSRFHCYNFFSQQTTEDPLFSGRIDKHKVKLIINQLLVDWDEVDEVLICGPNAMTEELIFACHENGIPKENIHYELFTTSIPIHTIEENKKEGPTTVDIVLDRKNYKIIWEKKGISLLDTIIDEGIDPPYSCKGGVCSACTCKLVNGNVKMDEDQMVLLESDIKNGLFLPCMTFNSESSNILINFDEV